MLLRKVMWTVLATACGALAARFAGIVWRVATNEAPPKKSSLAGWLFGRAVKSGTSVV